jgi:cytochrome c-type biogenesis protein CcmH
VIVSLMRAFLLAVLLASGGAALAIDAEDAFDDPVLQQRYEKINRELRCLVCQNQTIADSNATLAQDLRREVRDMIAAGQTDDEIRDFMIERYGDFVLYRPRMTAGNFLLWAAPVLLLVIGAFVLVRVVRRRGQETDLETDGPEAGQS